MSIIVINVVVLFIIILVELIRRPKIRLDFLFIFHAHFALAYLIAPILVTIYPQWLEHLSYLSPYAHNRNTDIPWVVLTGYLVFLLGWITGQFMRVRPFSFNLSHKECRKMIMVGLFGALCALAALVSSFGGLSTALSLGAQYRYGSEAGNIVLGSAEVFKHFGDFAIFVLYYSIAKVFYLSQEKQFYIKVALAAAAIIVLQFIIVASRGSVVNVLLCLCIIHNVANPRAIGLRFLFLIPASIIVVLFGKQFYYSVPYLLTLDYTNWIAHFNEMSAMRIQDGNWFVNSLLRESFHCVTSLELAYEHAGNTLPYLFFRDYFWLPVSIIPANLMGLSFNEPHSVSALNTYLHGGALIASTPPGLVGSFFYHMGYLGLIIGMFSYGYLGNLFQRKLLDNRIQTAGHFMCFPYTALLYGTFAINGDIKVYVFSSAAFVLLVIYLYANKIFKLGKNVPKNVIAPNS